MHFVSAHALLAQSASAVRGDTNIEMVTGILLFMIAGFLMAFAALLVGRLVRPKLSHPEKGAIYECGEPVLGESWVQFDLRFYVVALVFIVFDVEIALFWPWAVVFGSYDAATVEGAAVKTIALYDMLFFFGVVVVGFSFLWRFGYLDWVRASTGQRRVSQLEPVMVGTRSRPTGGSAATGLAASESGPGRGRTMERQVQA